MNWFSWWLRLIFFLWKYDFIYIEMYFILRCMLKILTNDEVKKYIHMFVFLDNLSYKSTLWRCLKKVQRHLSIYYFLL